MGAFLGCVLIAFVLVLGFLDIQNILRRGFDRICEAHKPPAPHDVARSSERDARRLVLLAEAQPCQDRTFALLAFIDPPDPGREPDPDLMAHLDSCPACAGAVDRVFQADAAALVRLGRELQKRAER